MNHGPTDFPAAPPSEVEWEDLLLKIEVMPRALRFVLEGVSQTDPAALSVLAELVEREEEVGYFLERAVGMSSPGASRGAGQVIAVQSDAVDRFVRCRTRNFAMVQRRGIDVWEWAADRGQERATVHQVIAYLASADVAALARLRVTGRPE